MAASPRVRNEPFRAARLEADLSQDDLAARLRSNGVAGATKKQVQRFESGEVAWPQAHYRKALRAIFGRSATELGFRHPAGPNGDRRVVADGVVSAAVASATSYERVRYALAHDGGAITREDAEFLLRTSAEFYDRDATETAAALAPDLARHLDLVATLLSMATLGESVRRTLVLAAGVGACLGGWISYNLSATTEANGYWRAAVDAAKAANDGPLLSCVLTFHSYLLDERGDHRGAWNVLHQARDHVRARGHARTRAWISARQAEEAAALGERSSALASLAEAMTVYDHTAHTESVTRPWVRHFDAVRLRSMGVAAYGRLDHPRLLPAADAVLAALRGDQPKTRAVILGDVAAARVASGDLDAGCALAHRALAATTRFESVLGYRRLRTLRSTLDRHGNVTAVQALLPALDAAGITTA